MRLLGTAAERAAGLSPAWLTARALSRVSVTAEIRHAYMGGRNAESLSRAVAWLDTGPSDRKIAEVAVALLRRGSEPAEAAAGALLAGLQAGDGARIGQVLADAPPATCLARLLRDRRAPLSEVRRALLEPGRPECHAAAAAEHPDAAAALEPAEWAERLRQVDRPLPASAVAVAWTRIAPTSEDVDAVLAIGHAGVVVRALLDRDAGVPTSAQWRVLLADASRRAVIAGHPLAPAGVLRELAYGSDASARAHVRANPGAPEDARVAAALAG